MMRSRFTSPLAPDVLQVLLTPCCSYFVALPKKFAQPLNGVIIVKTGARAHAALFSGDLALPYEQLVDYDGLRF